MPSSVRPMAASGSLWCNAGGETVGRRPERCLTEIQPDPNSMRPSTRVTIRSQRCARRGSWVTIRKAVPLSPLNLAHQREDLVGRMGVEVAGRLVGEHQRRRRARTRGRSRRAAAGRPRACAAGSRARSPRPTARSSSRARLAPLGRDRPAPAIRPGISTFSSRRERRQQVVELEDEARCVRAAERGDVAFGERRGLAARRSVAPAVGGSSRPIRLSSVDLPEPDGPISAVNSPGASTRSMPCSTSTSTSVPAP